MPLTKWRTFFEFTPCYLGKLFKKIFVFFRISFINSRNCGNLEFLNIGSNIAIESGNAILEALGKNCK